MLLSELITYFKITKVESSKERVLFHYLAEFLSEYSVSNKILPLILCDAVRFFCVAMRFFHGLRLMKLATFLLIANHHALISLESLQQAMWPTHIIDKPLQLPLLAAKQELKSDIISMNWKSDILQSKNIYFPKE